MRACRNCRASRCRRGCGASGTTSRCRRPRPRWPASPPSRRRTGSCSAATGRSPMPAWSRRRSRPTRRSPRFHRFRERLDRMRIARIDAPARAESNGLWFRDPDGTPIEIRVAEKSSPNEKSSFAMLGGIAGVAAAPSRSKVAMVQPRRLAHMLIFTCDIPKAIKFYSEVLGLRLSDRSGDMIAFMHAIHGSDHHVIAFVKSDGPGLHHLSWDVGSVNDIGLGAMQMADKGFVAGWGLGRHGLGSNYFHYVRDPWGSYAEYSADVDYIPVDHDWQAADHPPADSFYVWGPVPPEDFAFNYEAAS